VAISDYQGAGGGAEEPPLVLPLVEVELVELLPEEPELDELVLEELVLVPLLLTRFESDANRSMRP
jgi:hypothetical protein